MVGQKYFPRKATFRHLYLVQCCHSAPLLIPLKRKYKFHNMNVFFFLKLALRYHISSKKFIQSSLGRRVHQYINTITFKFAGTVYPYYLIEAFEYFRQCRINRGSYFTKLKHYGQHRLNIFLLFSTSFSVSTINYFMAVVYIIQKPIH